MIFLDAVLFYISLLGYFVSLGFYLTYAFTRGEKYSRWARGILILTVGCHAGDLVARTLAGHSLPDHAWYVPWSDWFESFSLFAWMIAVVFLLVQAETHLPVLGAFIMPLACLALASALTHVPASISPESLDFLRRVDAARVIPPVKPEFQSVWMILHVPVIFASYAAFANAFGIGIAFLIQERQIKSKKPSEFCYRLPALEDLDGLIYRIIRVALPLLTVGLILGSLWAHAAWGRWWGWDAKETWALITWLVYAGYLYMRLGRGWRGRRAAYLSMAGFAVILFTYVGVNFFSKKHGFLSRPAAAAGKVP